MEMEEKSDKGMDVEVGAGVFVSLPSTPPSTLCRAHRQNTLVGL